MSYLPAMTAGMGSGKTAVSELPQKHDAALIDTVVIVRQLTSAGGAVVRRRLPLSLSGASIVTDAGLDALAAAAQLLHRRHLTAAHDESKRPRRPH